MLDDTKRSQAANDDQSGLNNTAIFRNTPTESVDPQTQASLIVISGWEIGRELRLNKDSTTLGRSYRADFLINAPSVSRIHARIEKRVVEDAVQFVVYDEGSSNGIYVNNRPCQEARLYPGDKLRLGDVLFKFLILDEIDARFHQEVQRLIYYDHLTGLMTMEAFRPKLDLAIRKAKKQQGVFCLIMADLDGLKRVNDTYGHLAGRMVVREMGVILRKQLRSNDIGALYGGDETLLLFPDTPLDEGLACAEGIRQAFAQRTFIHHETSIQVTISQGIAVWPQHATEPEALIAAADKALYRAKALGRNHVCTASELD